MRVKCRGDTLSRFLVECYCVLLLFLATGFFFGWNAVDAGILNPQSGTKVDTFEQNKRFLSASFRKFKKHIFCPYLNPLSPFSMLKYASLTLSRGYNTEKGRGRRNVKIGD